MPYYIRQDAPDCEGKWATVGAEGKIHGCHDTKKAAIDQAVAISISTGERFEGDWRNKDNRKA